MIIHFSILAVIIVAACIWGRYIRVRKPSCLAQRYDYTLIAVAIGFWVSGISGGNALWHE